MITGSAARNPEELGPGFLNIHKTLMCLYSALHQGMSAIYIMLPLRSVTASLSLFLCLTPSLALSLALAFFFQHDFFPQRASEHCLFPSASLALSLSFCDSMNACTFHECHGIEGREKEGEKERARD